MRFVLLSCLITAVLGSGLYFAKLSVDEQYRTLKRLEEEIKIQTEHNYVLQAEWTFLTRPERLLELSESIYPKVESNVFSVISVVTSLFKKSSAFS